MAKRPTTTEQGLGWEHQRARAAAIADLAANPGRSCWRCKRPMYVGQALDFDHVISRVLGGHRGPRKLAHASCNRSAGASLGNRLRGRAKKPKIRRW